MVLKIAVAAARLGHGLLNQNPVTKSANLFAFPGARGVVGHGQMTAVCVVAIKSLLVSGWHF